MKANATLAIVGQAATLVPYRPAHVDTYHGWMQGAHLQEMTASEPLSIEEEREMCATWARDEDKLTFIVLDRAAGPAGGAGAGAVGPRPGGGAMVGDVNLFRLGADVAEAAEVEVMVAVAPRRRCGLGREAVLLMLHYAVHDLKRELFVAKVLEHNAPSLAFFAKLGFLEARRVPVFREVHLEATAAELRPALDAAAALASRQEC